MRKNGRVRVWKHPVGVYSWDCDAEACNAPDDNMRSGASLFWEIAQHQADAHAREWHTVEQHTSHDMPTPPGGTHYDWSDTGMHVRVVIPAPRGESQ